MAFRNWSDREIHLLKCLGPVWPLREVKKALDELGYPRGTRVLRHKITELKASFVELGRPRGEFSEAEAKVIARVTNRIFNIEEPAGVELLVSEIINACGPSRVPTINTGGDILLVCLSDLHYGSRIVDAAGTVLYDTDTAESMLGEVLPKVLECAPEKDYTSIVYLFLGDMVDGEEIFPTHQSEIDAAAIDQVAGLHKALWNILHQSSERFPQVYALCVRGNHGRISRSASERSNWDNALYQQLHIMASMSRHPNIEVHIAHGEYMNFLVNGWRGHLRHQAVPHDGTAASRNKLGSWHEMHEYDFLVCGHFHHTGRLGYNGIPVYRNGQLKVGGAYGERIGRRDPPEQIIFGVSDKEVETFFRTISWKVEWE